MGRAAKHYVIALALARPNTLHDRRAIGVSVAFEITLLASIEGRDVFRSVEPEPIAGPGSACRSSTEIDLEANGTRDRAQCGERRIGHASFDLRDVALVHMRALGDLRL